MQPEFHHGKKDAYNIQFMLDSKIQDTLNYKRFGRLAQWESASFTRKRSQVQSLHRLPLKSNPHASFYPLTRMHDCMIDRMTCIHIIRAILLLFKSVLNTIDMINSVINKKRYSVISLLLCLLLFLTPNAVANTKDEIRVVAALYEPFVYYEDGKLVGFDIDLLDIICHSNKLSYSIKVVSFQEALTMLNEGNADVGIGAIYVTDERRRFINFTEPYLKTGLVYVIRTVSDMDGDLSNKKIGVKRLATGEKVAMRLAERFQNLSVIPFDSTEQSIDALIDGRVDVVINDYLNTESLMYERYRGKIKIKKGLAGLPELLTRDEIAIAISKQRPDILRQFDATLKNLKKSGMIESLLEHWPSIHLLPDVRRYLIYIIAGITVITLLTLLMFRSLRKRQVIQLLRESEERYRAITENSPDAIITADSQGIIILANNSTLRLFGYNRDELIGNALTILMPEQCRDEHITGFERFRKTGNARLIGKTYETMGKRKDGIEFPVELSLSSWQVRGQTFFTGILRDLTERKKVEDRLLESERRFRSLIENAPNPVFINSEDGGAVFVNRRFREITGYNLTDVDTLERFAERAFPDSGYRIRMLKRFEEILKSDSPIIDGEDMNITCSDGSVRIWNLQTSPIGLWGDKRAVMFVGRDVTEHRRLEEQLRQAQKMELIGRFTGGIAHDFNNYLTAITGFSQIALLQSGEHPAVSRSIENVLKAAQKASDLVSKLLAFSRTQMLKPEVVCLNDIITDITKMIKRIIGEDIELRLLLDPQLWSTRVDVGQIEQVIMNLVSNARDAMPNGGVLTIQTSNVILDDEHASRHVSVIPGEYVLMAIEDTGVGMTEEVKNRIFEPFFTTKEHGKGTGLGLATVYGIVKQSGGNIWVYSELGEGTTFKIYLPMVMQEKKTQLSKECVRDLPKGNENILVVEDNKEVRDFLKRFLSELGYNICEAADGIEALEVLKDKGKTIALVLTDVIMPSMRGDKLAERIKEEYPECKVLFMSGYADNVITENGILKEGINYLQKPIAPVTLAQLVRKVLDS